MTRAARRRRRLAVLVLTFAAILWGGWKWSRVLSYRRAIARAEEQIEQGLYSRAARELQTLSDQGDASDEALLLLGACEKGLGRTDEAIEAWSRVSPSSEFAFPALENRVELELEQGRLTGAELLVQNTRQNPQFNGPDPAILLGAIYCRAGRVDEARRLLESLWDRHNAAGEASSETAINQLWLYIQLESNPIPDETIRAILEHAGQVAPGDDRIWLWKANFAIHTRRYDEAALWLDRCTRKTPDDPSVWRAKLDLAVATNRQPEVRDALRLVPPNKLKPAEVERLAARFARRRGDLVREQECLKRLVAAEPTDTSALDRLIEISSKNGRSNDAGSLRRRKEEIARLRTRYQALYKRHQPRRDAVEMGRLAAQLGHRFEAKAFLTLALAAAPDRDDLRGELNRLSRDTEREFDSSRSLEDLLSSAPTN